MVEGSGAVGVAALLQKKVYKPGGPVVVVLSGANIDAAKHAAIVAAAAHGAPAGTGATSTVPR